jgi:hypothetical protein
MVPLQGLFVQLLADRPATADVNVFIEHCRRIAVAYLRRRSRLGRLRLDQFDLSEEDLAASCSAPSTRASSDAIARTTLSWVGSSARSSGM